MVWNTPTSTQFHIKPLAACVAATVILGGCGRGSVNETGQRIFKNSCAHCHTLTGHDTPIDGGDLAVGSLSAVDVASFVRVMPLRRPLTPTQVRAVSRYVAALGRAK